MGCVEQVVHVHRNPHKHYLSVVSGGRQTVHIQLMALRAKCGNTFFLPQNFRAFIHSTEARPPLLPVAATVCVWRVMHCTACTFSTIHSSAMFLVLAAQSNMSRDSQHWITCALAPSVEAPFLGVFGRT